MRLHKPDMQLQQRYEVDQATGASILSGKAEGTGLVPPQEGMTERVPHQFMQVSERRVLRQWAQGLLGGAKQ